MPDDLTPAERGRAWTVVERAHKIRSIEDGDDIADAFVVHDNDRCLHRELAGLDQAQAQARADTAERERDEYRDKSERSDENAYDAERTVEQLREELAKAWRPVEDGE